MNVFENNCVWHFGIDNGRSEGPFDATGQNFKQRPYASLLRESVQNSLDAHINVKNTDGSVSIPTVEISFSFGSLKTKYFPEFCKIRDHIKSCYDSHSNDDYRMFYTDMLNNFDTNYVKEIPYLKISDINTTGMKYVPTDLSNSFQAFVRSSQISVKGNVSGAAGSHGYGKAAYYLLSPIRTLLVSTMTEDGECYFEGVSIIGSHVKDGEILCAAGYYDNNDGKPIYFNSNSKTQSNCNIPIKFRREKPGTDFYIIGFPHDRIGTIRKEMIHEALRSYWLAIYKGRVCINIKLGDDDIKLDKFNLHSLMCEYYPESIDESKQLRALNPRPYYEAFTKQNSGDKSYISFTETFPTIGNVTMYVKKCKTKYDKIIYMRKPLMLVSAPPKDDDNGYYGLFLCENDEGDRLLRKLENSSHTEWKSSNYVDVNNKPYPDGEKALKEIEQFTENCIKKMFGCKDGNIIDIAGLSDFLYVPDSLIDDDDEIEHLIGQPNGGINDDGSLIKTIPTQLKVVNSTSGLDNCGSVIIEDEGRISNENNHFEFVPSGKHSGGDVGPEHFILDGNKSSNLPIEPLDGKHLKYIDVPMRVFCKEEDGNNYHIVTIHSDKAIDNVKLVLNVCLDEEDEKMIPIIFTNIGMASGNIIENISLVAGTTKIKILFADNLQHTVIKKIYYDEK